MNWGCNSKKWFDKTHHKQIKIIMKDINFPVFKTKMEGVTEKFNLNDPAGRKKYFEAKAGPEIEKIKKYLENKTFVAFLLGKKNSGKGTYSKLFMELMGTEHVGHLSVGDLVRDVHGSLASPEKKQELVEFLSKNYRGFHTVEETMDLIEGRSQEKLVSSELILALIKYEISKRPRQALFIDGFPRGLDQIGYSLFLKEMIGYQEHPDFFVFIDVPESVIDARIKSRVVCPICKTPRNLKLAMTQNIGYDEATKTPYLICDDPKCNGARMVTKEGDELGIEPIRARLETDDAIFKQLLNLSGVDKIKLRNAVPVTESDAAVDDYEITPGYDLVWDEAAKKVNIVENPWVIKDDNGVDCVSLLPAAVALGLVKQVAGILEI